MFIINNDVNKALKRVNVYMCKHGYQAHSTPLFFSRSRCASKQHRCALVSPSSLTRKKRRTRRKLPEFLISHHVQTSITLRHPSFSPSPTSKPFPFSFDYLLFSSLPCSCTNGFGRAERLPQSASLNCEQQFGEIMNCP